jgi:hypothetical protein
LVPGNGPVIGTLSDRGKTGLADIRIHRLLEVEFLYTKKQKYMFSKKTFFAEFTISLYKFSLNALKIKFFLSKIKFFAALLIFD